MHLWYEEKFGIEVEPYISLEDAISTWPEPATCVGVYLDRGGFMQIIAPYGLDDLFTITLRRNPIRITKEIFEQRLLSKNMIAKWPKLNVIFD